MRSSVTVRTAVADDLPELVTLALAARQEAGSESVLCTDDPVVLTDQLAAALALPGSIVLVGVHDEGIDGVLFGRIVGPALFCDRWVIDLDAVYVRQETRRRGMGHALLTELVSFSQECGVTEVVAAPLPAARGMHRFLARVGFQSAASHRVATVAALQRRLVSDASAPRSGSIRQISASGGVSRLIERRRRARGGTGDQVAEPYSGCASSQSSAGTSMQVNRAVASLRPVTSSMTTS